MIPMLPAKASTGMAQHSAAENSYTERKYGLYASFYPVFQPKDAAVPLQAKIGSEEPFFARFPPGAAVIGMGCYLFLAFFPETW